MVVVRKVDGDSTGPHSQQVSVCSLVNVCFFLLPLEGYAGRHMIDRFATYGSLLNGCHQKNYINSSTRKWSLQ